MKYLYPRFPTTCSDRSTVLCVLTPGPLVMTQGITWQEHGPTNVLTTANAYRNRNMPLSSTIPVTDNYPCAATGQRKWSMGSPLQACFLSSTCTTIIWHARRMNSYMKRQMVRDMMTGMVMVMLLPRMTEPVVLVTDRTIEFDENEPSRDVNMLCPCFTTVPALPRMTRLRPRLIRSCVRSLLLISRPLNIPDMPLDRVALLLRMAVDGESVPIDYAEESQVILNIEVNR